MNMKIESKLLQDAIRTQKELNAMLDFDSEEEHLLGEHGYNCSIDINRDDLWFLFNLAHSWDMSLNECVNKILLDVLKNNEVELSGN